MQRAKLLLTRWKLSLQGTFKGEARFSRLFFTSIPVYLFLLYIYRVGSQRVDGGNNLPGPRDVGVYINAAIDILTGVNPYQNSASRFGSFGPLPFILLSPFDATLAVAITQMLGMVGFQYFIFTLSRMYFLRTNWLIPVIPLFASSRENLVTAQVTGILCGLIAIACAILLKEKTLLNTFLASILFALVLDLKPHIFMFFSFVVLIYLGRVIVFFNAVFIMICAHTSIDLLHGEFLEVSWFRTLGSIESKASSGTFTDSHTFWPIISAMFGETTVITIISTLLFCLIGVSSLFLSKSRGLVNAPILALLAPAFSIYFHLYDLVIFACLVLAVLGARLKPGKELFLSFVVSQCIQGTSFFSISSYIFFLFSWIIFNFICRISIYKWSTRLSLLGFFVSIGLNLLVGILVPGSFIHSARTSLVIMFLLLALLVINSRIRTFSQESDK